MSGEENTQVEAAPAPQTPGVRRGPLIAAITAGAVLILAVAAYLLSPRVSVAGFEIQQTRDTHFKFSLKLAIQNRLPVDIRVDAYEFFLDVNDEQLGHTHQSEPTEIPAWETTHVTIDVEGYEQDLPEWLQMGRRMAPVKREYEYHFRGWVKLGRPFGFHYNFDTSGKFPGFAMPDMIFGNIRLARMDLFNPEVDLDVRFVNPNGIGITHKNFRADVLINGIPVGVVQKPEPVYYEPRAERTETFRFKMESMRGGAAMVQVFLSGGEIMLRLKGSVDVHMKGYGEFPFEFDKEGPAPIQATGLFGGQRRGR